jgi:hypothetical protein
MLLDQFLSQECTPHVQRLLGEAIADMTTSNSRFEFNRFEVTIERETGTVLLEDVLDASEAGTERVPLAAFTQALVRCSAR